MQKTRRRLMRTLLGGVLALQGVLCTAALAQTSDSDIVVLNVDVQPYVELELTQTLLEVWVPPLDTTHTPPAGAVFKVKGNTAASVSATPDAFIQVQNFDYDGAQVPNAWLGRAELNNETIGYYIEVRFPTGPGSQSEFLPLLVDEGTAPLTVDVSAAPNNTVNGIVHLISNADWTTSGFMPPPGTYVGLVTLTVTGV